MDGPQNNVSHRQGVRERGQGKKQEGGLEEQRMKECEQERDGEGERARESEEWWKQIRDKGG